MKIEIFILGVCAFASKERRKFGYAKPVKHPHTMGRLNGALSLTVLIFAEAGFAQIETSREKKRHASNRPFLGTKPQREVLIEIV